MDYVHSKCLYYTPLFLLIKGRTRGAAATRTLLHFSLHGSLAWLSFSSARYFFRNR